MANARSDRLLLGHVAAPVQGRECMVILTEGAHVTAGAYLLTDPGGFLLRSIHPNYDSGEHRPESLSERMRMMLPIRKADSTRTGTVMGYDCEILGRPDGNGRIIIGEAPAPGEAVYFAGPDALMNTNGGVPVGELWPTGEGISIPRKVLSLPSGVFGDPGSGKTYWAQTVGEAYALRGVRCFAIELSPDLEYTSWAEQLTKRIPVHIVPIGPGHRLPFSRLEPPELLELSGVLTEDQEDLLVTAFASLASKARPTSRQIKFSDLLGEVDNIGQRQKRERVSENLKARLTYRFEHALGFIDREGPGLTLPSDGLTVFQLSTHPYRELVAAALCTLIEQARLAKRIPPCVVLLDEAHSLVPHDRDLPSRRRIRLFVRLSRHLHIVPWLISQSPKSIDRQVLDILKFLYLFALSGDNLGAVRDFLSRVHRDLVGLLPTLPTGTCLLVGPQDMVPFPIFFRPGGRTTIDTAPNPDIFDSGNAAPKDEAS